MLNQAFPWGPPEAQAAGEPVVQFAAPEGTVRYVDDADPIDPSILIDVEVNFPDATTPCAGAPLPVDPNTLEVKVHRQLDGEQLETWDNIDEGTWTWNAQFNNVAGQVTIGGTSSGQIRSLYGIEVCIENDSARSCATKGIRVEHPVDGFTAVPVYITRGTSFSQRGAGCNLIPSIGIPFINEQMATTEFYTVVPSGAAIAAGGAQVEFVGIPLLGVINMPAALDTVDNDVDLTEVAVSGIELKVLTYDCVISGKADGSLMGEVSPGQDLDGSIRVYDLIVEDGPGGCGLTAAPTCELHIGFDGNR